MYAAYVNGLSHRWSYIVRRIRDIEDLLQPLEDAIRQHLIPALTLRRHAPSLKEIFWLFWLALAELVFKICLKSHQIAFFCGIDGVSRKQCDDINSSADAVRAIKNDEILRENRLRQEREGKAVMI